MASFNSVTLVGNLTRNPDIKTRKLDDGNTRVIATTGIAVNRKYKDKEEVMFIEIVAFGRIAEIIGEYLIKGSPVLISGRLSMNKWTADDGTNRVSHGVIVEELQMLGTKKTAE